MVIGILIGLFIGAILGAFLLGMFAAGARDDAYLQGRLDEITDAARDAAHG